ncbi:hypothetical protein [Pseudonocardia sp. GCM10023141]|uniref:hypothetical protein n=1 Tax=Pseudonocardia sp. GCM10023141 TaxID=3252653 RepID=UPI00361C119D
MPRLRHTIVLAACALLAGILAVLAVIDPLHLRHARWFTAGLVLLTVVLLTAALAVAARRGVLRAFVVVVGVVVGVLWVGLIGFAAQFTTGGRDVATIADGDRRLVVVEGGGVAVAPIFAVVVRSGAAGPFEQESLVYQGLEGVPAPTGLLFVDHGTVEVQRGPSCLYRSEVTVTTLDVEPVHRQLRLTGC